MSYSTYNTTAKSGRLVYGDDTPGKQGLRQDLETSAQRLANSPFVRSQAGEGAGALLDIRVKSAVEEIAQMEQLRRMEKERKRKEKERKELEEKLVDLVDQRAKQKLSVNALTAHVEEYETVQIPRAKAVFEHAESVCEDCKVMLAQMKKMLYVTEFEITLKQKALAEESVGVAGVTAEVLIKSFRDCDICVVADGYGLVSAADLDGFIAKYQATDHTLDPATVLHNLLVELKGGFLHLNKQFEDMFEKWTEEEQLCLGRKSRVTGKKPTATIITAKDRSDGFLSTLDSLKYRVCMYLDLDIDDDTIVIPDFLQRHE